MDKIGMLGIGVILVILGIVLQMDTLINFIGFSLIALGVVLFVLGLIKTFSGSESDY